MTESISSRVMVMLGEHLIQGNGHARRTSHPPGMTFTLDEMFSRHDHYPG
jgi:hypothetical protein